jgi:3-hydroxybutyryl-CoA dehydrogenase
MGAGIALAVAAAGFDVDLVEVDPAVRERALVRIQKDAARLAKPEAPARIHFVSSIDALGDTDLAIEAVPEDLTLKSRIFADLERKLGSSTILATNTSSLSVAEIAQTVAHPQRVVGLHFFNPATMMQLVEVVHTKETPEAVLEVARAFVRSIGKTAVDVADTPGFIVNRVARPYYLQSLHALENELAPAEDLDLLARGAGFKMGPFELMDLIGLDINFATTQSVYERTRAERLAPVPLQQMMVAQGRLGRKTSSGFYDYPQGTVAARPGPEPLEAPPFNDDEHIVVLGFGDLAEQLVELLSQTYANVEHIALDEQLEELGDEVTILFDVGDGTADRADVLAALDRRLSPEAVIFADAYATSITKHAAKFSHPERFVGYGIIGSFDAQRIVEIVDSESMSDDAAALAEEVFGALGKRVILIGDAPGLYLGRTIASIVNEAVYAVQEGVADADDIDLAMRLGTNYPLGPIAWGREIGGARIARILIDLANAEGKQYAPARALWVLDASEEEQATPMEIPG